MDRESLKFIAPATCLVSGPSQSGKTTWIVKVIQDAESLFTLPPQRVIYCYSEYSPKFAELPSHVELQQGFPDMKSLRADPSSHKLVILDDLMQEASKTSQLDSLATRGCHHLCVSLFILVQNAFYAGLRTCRLNSQYMCLFRNIADASQITTLQRQMFGGRSTALRDAYADATAEQHNYLLIDLHPRNYDPRLRLRSHIFPSETPILYLAKESA